MTLTQLLDVVREDAEVEIVVFDEECEVVDYIDCKDITEIKKYKKYLHNTVFTITGNKENAITVSLHNW